MKIRGLNYVFGLRLIILTIGLLLSPVLLQVQGGNPVSKTDFDFKKGLVIMKIGDNNTFSIAHELKHAYQFEIGELNITIPKCSIIDKQDEWQAYHRGELFGGPHLTKLPDDYDKLPVGPLNYKDLRHYQSSPEIYREIVSRYNFDFAVRIKGKTYISTKKK